jgi:hypothetical protein
MNGQSIEDLLDQIEGNKNNNNNNNNNNNKIKKNINKKYTKPLNNKYVDVLFDTAIFTIIGYIVFKYKILLKILSPKISGLYSDEDEKKSSIKGDVINITTVILLITLYKTLF